MSGPEKPHTPLPWLVDPKHPLCIESPTGNVALTNLARDNPADARLIVKAVNHHDRLYHLAVRAEQELICAQSYASSRRVMSPTGLAIMAKLIELIHAECNAINKGA
jgi:hypothetical protein